MNIIDNNRKSFFKIPKSILDKLLGRKPKIENIRDTIVQYEQDEDVTVVEDYDSRQLKKDIDEKS